MNNSKDLLSYQLQKNLIAEAINNFFDKTKERLDIGHSGGGPSVMTVQLRK